LTVFLQELIKYTVPGIVADRHILAQRGCFRAAYGTR